MLFLFTLLQSMSCYYFAENTFNVMSDVRNRCAEKSWGVFNDYLEKTPPLNGKFLLFGHFCSNKLLSQQVIVSFQHV